MVRVRIAPSPTGFAHVGTGYMALFNYAFAKKNKGKFILRLEDTDIKREVRGAEDAIYKGLAWLGLSWDEGPDVGGKYEPYKQSERLEIYKKRAKELVDKGLAYEEEGAIRFKNPGKDRSWEDLVRGKVTFPGGEVTDFIIMKSDGFPTYHFGVVVDDIDMEITHVIRGEDHISNTPKHLALYEAFGVKPPVYAHLPTLRNAETGKKLSKRRDTVDLRIFREEGYLPEALVNFMCLQGWSHPEEKEIFSLDEFVDKFDIKRVRKAGPKFDVTKLDWINGEYIRKLSDAELCEKLQFQKIDKNKKLEITKLVKDRIKTLKEFDGFAKFFWEEPKVNAKLFGENYKDHLKVVKEVVENTRNWDLVNLNNDLMEAVKTNSFKTGDFYMSLRIAITGNKYTPPINDSIIILGREKVLSRLGKVLSI